MYILKRTVPFSFFMLMRILVKAMLGCEYLLQPILDRFFGDYVSIVNIGGMTSKVEHLKNVKMKFCMSIDVFLSVYQYHFILILMSYYL